MPEKLVRDKIPEIIQKSGKTPKIRVASKSELKQLLLEKVLEEATELKDSGRKEEIADVLEAIYSLLKTENFTLSDIEKIRIKKSQERGSFDKRIVLVGVNEPK